MTFGTMQSRDDVPVMKESWGWLLLIGIVFLIGGLLAFAAPITASLVVALYVGIALVIAGLFGIAHAFRVREWSGFIWLLLVGVVMVLGGGAIAFNPVAGALTLTWVLSIVLVAKGVFQIIAGLRWRPRSGWGWLVAAGIVAMLAGALIIAAWPFSGVTAPGFIAGVSLVMSGASYVAMALMARRLA